MDIIHSNLKLDIMKHSKRQSLVRIGIRKLIPPAIFASLFLLFSVSPASAALAPQFAALDITAPIISPPASDPQAALFMNNTLPTLNAWQQTNLPKYQAQNQYTTTSLDPSLLTLRTTQDVQVFFVGNYGGYQNTLGINTSGTSVISGNPQIIFPSSQSPSPGSFVDLGTMQAGTILNFFLISNGMHGGTNVFSTTASANPDGFNHVVEYVAPDSPYLLLSFEDMYIQQNTSGSNLRPDRSALSRFTWIGKLT